MISTRPAIPLLVHEDCMDSIKFGLAEQQASLSNIANNTEETAGALPGIRTFVEDIARDTYSIKTTSSSTDTATSSLKSSVGTTADTSTSNTVIGLLKSISNKLSL